MRKIVENNILGRVGSRGLTITRHVGHLRHCDIQLRHVGENLGVQIRSAEDAA